MSWGFTPAAKWGRPAFYEGATGDQLRVIHSRADLTVLRGHGWGVATALAWTALELASAGQRVQVLTVPRHAEVDRMGKLIRALGNIPSQRTRVASRWRIDVGSGWIDTDPWLEREIVIHADAIIADLDGDMCWEVLRASQRFAVRWYLATCSARFAGLDRTPQLALIGERQLLVIDGGRFGTEASAVEHIRGRTVSAVSVEGSPRVLRQVLGGL